MFTIHKENVIVYPILLLLLDILNI